MIDNRSIEAFLAVVNTKSISRAAELLYTTQPSISKWVHQLEEEIGSQLFVRHKGHRSVELTAIGKNLIPLAEEWLALNKQILSIKESAHPSIRMSCIDSLNSTFLPNVIKSIQKIVPDLEVSIATNYSTAIYSMVERKLADLGFTLHEQHSSNLIVKPFMSEPYQLLIYGDDYDDSKSVRPTDLDIHKNIYYASGLAYQQWHDYWWQSSSYIHIDSFSVLREVFCENGLWTIVPAHVAICAKLFPGVHALPLAVLPPARICYLVTHKYPRESCKKILPEIEKLLFSFNEQTNPKNT